CVYENSTTEISWLSWCADPITGIARCCARAASGHATVAPPSSVMKSRRFTARCLPCSRPRIAHLGPADCCIHPPAWDEMTQIMQTKIFTKEVAQNRPPHFCARTFSPPEIVSDQISGGGLDENLKPKSPPYRGGPT